MRLFLAFIRCPVQRASAVCAFVACLACGGSSLGQSLADQPPSTGADGAVFSYHREDGEADLVADASNPLRPPGEQPVAAPTAEAPRYDDQFQAVEYAAPIEDDPYALVAAAAAVSVEPPAAEPPLVEAPAAEPAAAPLTPVGAALPGTPVSVAPVAMSAAMTSLPADDRRLAPPSSAWESESPGVAAKRRATAPSMFARLKGMSSAGAGLAVVIALLLACAFLMRRSGPKPGGILPSDAFSVLGRAPLTSQSFAQLLRIGNKLVLVAMSADGAQPLAEVTDPGEVDRIAGLCVGGRSGGSSAEFQQVLAQLSREPARGFIGREGSAARRR